MTRPRTPKASQSTRTARLFTPCPPTPFRVKQESGETNLIRGKRGTQPRSLFVMLHLNPKNPRYGRLARTFVIGLAACSAVASNSTLPAPAFSDQRGARLEAFFKAYGCPAPLHVDEYLRAADTHALDYRLLPAISLVESTCGAFERLNNRWGWDSAQSGFSSVTAGIEFITTQLAEAPTYKGKSLKEKLFTYNPYPQYVRQVEKLMRQIED